MEPASPQPSMSAAAAASPDTIMTGCTEPPLTSMSQVSHAKNSRGPVSNDAVMERLQTSGTQHSIMLSCISAHLEDHHALDTLQDLCSSPPACAVQNAGRLPLAGGATPGHKAGDGGAIVALKVRPQHPCPTGSCAHPEDLLASVAWQLHSREHSQVCHQFSSV